MTFDGDQRTSAKFITILLKEEYNILTDVGWPNVIKAELNNARQLGLGFEKQFGEIHVLGEHHSLILSRPQHDF
jgi:hypothetical protein